jgi:hypothetical protein
VSGITGSVSAAQGKNVSQKQLGELFEQLGARNPQEWARSQIEEGLPQLARFLFLRQAWRCVLPEGDTSWIPDALGSNPEEPGGEAVSALTRLLSLGSCAGDLTVVIRVMQWRVLAHFCQLLDDPGDLETSVENIAWRLFQVDDDENAISTISGLIESVLETDPTGREMRPR